MQQFSYIAEIFVIGGIASAAVIAVDLRSCRQPMRIMNSVWVLTGLWASFFGLWAYFAFGRTRSCLIHERASRTPDDKEAGDRMAEMSPGMRMENSSAAEMRMPDIDMEMGETPPDNMRMPDMQTKDAPMEGMQMDGMQMAGMPEAGMEMAGTPSNDMPMSGMRMDAPKPRWQSVVLSTLHCGAGCTLADLLGEWFLYFVPIAIGGSLLAGSWVLDYVLALLFGVGFQYAAIRGMERTLPRGVAIRRALKADFWSLTAWQAGMYGWMAVVIFALNGGSMLPRTGFAFWFMMQIAMACGFLVALPVNVVLIRRGIKHGM